jgi:hypothetical protein
MYTVRSRLFRDDRHIPGEEKCIRTTHLGSSHTIGCHPGAYLRDCQPPQRRINRWAHVHLVVPFVWLLFCSTGVTVPVAMTVSGWLPCDVRGSVPPSACLRAIPDTRASDNVQHKSCCSAELHMLAGAPIALQAPRPYHARNSMVYVGCDALCHGRCRLSSCRHDL